MKTVFYINGKKVSRKAAEEASGEERLKRLIQDAKAAFMEEPYVQNDYMISGGILTIEFC